MGDAHYTYDLKGNEWEALRLLWNRFHGQNEMSENDVLRIWTALEKYGFGCLKEGAVGGVQKTEDGNPTQDEITLWQDFMIYLMGGVNSKGKRGTFRMVLQIKSGNALLRAFRKFRMETLIPCYKEVYDVLSDALNHLVDKGELCRTKSQTITDDTLFWRSGDIAIREAGVDKCEQCCSKIADLGLRMDQRDFSTLHKRMLTPKGASKFVMRLFEELGEGYSVRMEVLKQCTFLKTRNMFSLQSVEYKDEIGSSESLDGGRVDNETDVEKRVRWEANRFNRIRKSDDELDGCVPQKKEKDSSVEIRQESLPDQQQHELAKAVAIRIWDRIGGMGESDQKILIGYIFPKIEGKKVPMRAFGKNTTVDYRIEKIFGAIRSELKAAMPLEAGCSYVEDPVVQLTIAALRKFCSENFENVCLDCSEEEKEECKNDSQH